MDKKEIQKKINNLPKPEYLYQRYNGEIRKYEVQDNLLINIKNANDIIDTDRQIILGKTSEDILDLLEVGDIVTVEEIDTEWERTVEVDEEEYIKYLKMYVGKEEKLKKILTHEQYEQNCYKLEVNND